MNNSKKGISLIVLVITIVVIIILAAAVIVSMNDNNPIESANKAVKEQEKSEVSNSISLFIGTYLANHIGVSPFIASADNFLITIGTNRTGDAPQNVLGWNDLGFTGAPISMKNLVVTYNARTGEFTVPNN